jgi:hypothetical protein
LDEEAVVGDGAGEDERVEGGSVEAFADERCGADDQQAVTGLGRVEAVDDRSAVGGAHRALQHERLMSSCGEHGGECLDVGDPTGEDQAVAPAFQSRGDIVGNQRVAWLVKGQPSVYLGQRARRVQIHVADRELGVVQEQNASWSGVGVHCGGEGALFLVRHGVSHGAELPGDELAEAVAAGGCGGEAEPELRGDRFDGVFVRGGAEVVALVDDDVTLVLGERGDVVASGQRWQ